MKYLLLRLRDALPGQELAAPDADAMKQSIQEKVGSQVFDTLIIDMAGIRYRDR